MKTIRYLSYGGIDAMEYADLPTPTPKDDEVLIKVHAAGVNPVDIAVSIGYMKDFRPLNFPIIAGSEVSGTIESVGVGVTEFKGGDAVHATTGISGAFAEFVALKASAVSLKPKVMGFAEAAGLPVAAATATSALNDGNVGKGTRIVIHAAAGGVGSITVQLAKLRGAEVVALASAENVAFVKSLGADRVVDRSTAYESEIKDMDVVLDGFGPPAQARSWGMLKKGGILLSLVAPPSEEEAKKHGVRSAMVYGTPTHEVLSAADALVEAGKLKVYVAKEYPLSAGKDALKQIATGKTRGKIIITV